MLGTFNWWILLCSFNKKKSRVIWLSVCVCSSVCLFSFVMFKKNPVHLSVSSKAHKLEKPPMKSYLLWKFQTWLSSETHARLRYTSHSVAQLSMGFRRWNLIWKKKVLTLLLWFRFCHRSDGRHGFEKKYFKLYGVLHSSSNENWFAFQPTLS